MGGLQQAIDQKFMDSGKLPADIDELRSAYRAFMDRFPWQDVNRIDRLGTPRELGQYVFGGTPERTAEIIKEASPEGKVALKEALTNRVLDAVNPDQPLAEQIKAARDALAPYVKNGAAASLYGAKNADEIRNIFYLPEHIQQWKDVVQTDEFHEGMVKEVAEKVSTKRKDGCSRTGDGRRCSNLCRRKLVRYLKIRRYRALNCQYCRARRRRWQVECGPDNRMSADGWPVEQK